MPDAPLTEQTPEAGDGEVRSTRYAEGVGPELGVVTVTATAVGDVALAVTPGTPSDVAAADAVAPEDATDQYAQAGAPIPTAPTVPAARARASERLMSPVRST